MSVSVQYRRRRMLANLILSLLWLWLCLHQVQAGSRWLAEYTPAGHSQPPAADQTIPLSERDEQASLQRKIDQLTQQAGQQASVLKQQQLRHRLLWIIVAIAMLLLAVSNWFLLQLYRSSLALKVLNRELHQTQSKLQATIDAIPDLMFVLDRAGTYLEFQSPRLTHLLYAPPTAILGKTIADVLPEQAAQTCMQAITEADEHGRSVGRQISLMLADGEHWFELSIAHKAEMPDETVQFICLSRDITERKKMEQALMASEQQFRALVENSPDGVVRYDRQGRRLYINPAGEHMLGLPKQSLLGKTHDDWTLPNSDSRYQQALQRVLATGEEARLTIQLNSGNGAEIYNDIRLVPEFDAAGQVVSVLELGRNVTDLKQAKQAIEDAYAEIRKLALRREDELEEQRKRIARDMHDELGQYLTSLRMRASTLRMQYGDRDELLAKQIQSITGLIDQAVHVVRGIVIQLRPAILDVGIVAALEGLTEHFSEVSGLRCHLSGNLRNAGIPEQYALVLFRCAQEALTNISRYAQASTVNVSLHQNETEYCLQIQDNGVGFVPTVVNSKSFGLLGMHERVHALGGNVDIISQPGQGTTVEIWLPVISRTHHA